MNEDLFKFEYTNPDFQKLRVFLGNGYQNIECSNNLGQGIGTCEFHKAPFPVLKLAGIYSYPPRITGESENPILNAMFRGLNTFGLYPLDDENPNHPTDFLIDNYLPPDFHQVLNMKTATVNTNAKIGNLDTKTEMFLSRHKPNVGFLKMKISRKDPGALTLFHHVRKDPFTKIDDISFIQHDDGVATWDIEIKEDKNEFEGLGPAHVLQATSIQVFDDEGNQIEFTSRWEGDGIDRIDPAMLDYDEILDYLEIIEAKCPKPSDDGHYRWNVLLYFGIFKKMDERDPFFCGLPDGNKLVPRAKEKMAEVMHNGYDQERESHVKAWKEDIWSGLIEIEMAADVQKMIISSFYIIGCTYLRGLSYGNGPGGVIGHPWDGRTFWDHDLWVNLGIVLWGPDLARNFNLFRYHTLDGAIQNRSDYINALEKLGVVDRLGLKVTDGARYAWESTSSGLERCPHPQGTGATTQEHINCDVIHGMYLQYLVTKDDGFLEEIAFPVAYQASLYLGQRLQKEADGKWHFRYILPADEFAVGGIDDNAFTNLYVDKCLRIVINWCKKLGKPYPEHWNEIIGNMKYHMDEKTKRIIEHEEYDGETIKQADTNLITWPLEHPAVYGEYGETLRRNNMLYYFEKLPENHIMMAACIFSIIAAELGMVHKALDYFKDQFPHFHPNQSYIPSEQPNNDCWPFITGIGGFLSNLIYGFGGIRLRHDGLLFSPFLPSEIKSLVIPRIKYQGKELRYVVKNGGRAFELTNFSEDGELTLYTRKSKAFYPESLEKVEFLENSTKEEKKYRLLLKKGIKVEFQFT